MQMIVEAAHQGQLSPLPSPMPANPFPGVTAGWPPPNYDQASLAYSKSSTTRVGSTGEAGGDGGSGGSIRAGVGGGKGVPPGTIVMFPAFGIAEYCTTPAVTGYVVELPPCVTVEVFHSAGTSVVKVIG